MRTLEEYVAMIPAAPPALHKALLALADEAEDVQK